MKTCDRCGTAFKIKQPREGSLMEDQGSFEYPGCDCYRKLREIEIQKEDEDRLREQYMARFKNLDIGDIDQWTEKLYRKCVIPAWNDAEIARSGGHLILQGVSGSGKTTQLKAVAAFLCLAGFLVRGGSTQAILRKLKSGDAEETMASLLRGQVLVLDDLDKLLGTRAEVENLLYVIDNYTKKNLCILVTMNGSFENLITELTSSKYQVSELTATALVSRLQDNADIILYTRELIHRSPRRIVEA